METVLWVLVQNGGGRVSLDVLVLLGLFVLGGLLAIAVEVIRRRNK